MSNAKFWRMFNSLNDCVETKCETTRRQTQWHILGVAGLICQYLLTDIFAVVSNRTAFIRTRPIRKSTNTYAHITNSNNSNCITNQVVRNTEHHYIEPIGSCRSVLSSRLHALLFYYVFAALFRICADLHRKVETNRINFI